MRLYNTLTGQQREFVPADGNTVQMYVCGVTPYSATHVGHALSYVIFDTLRRYLEHQGYGVRHIQNFTDVDDKIIQRAQESGRSETDLAERYIADFFRVMDALNIRRADAYPRATQEIPGILAAIQDLVDKGFAYPAAGDVYFRVRQIPDYGKLSHRTLEGMIAGARVQVDADKEHPMDFVLWKGGQARRTRLGQPLGAGPSRLAYRMHRHVPALSGLSPGHSRRRAGFDFPPSRKRNRPERGLYRGRALCPLLGA